MMNIEINKSAVVLIEFQNQWTGKGLYNWLIKGQLTSRNVLAKTMRTAIQKGIDSYLVSYCTTTMNGFFQWKTERKFRGKVVNHLKAIGWLSHT